MEQLLDFKKMYDLFTQAVKLATRDHDAEEVATLKQGIDLWTKMIVADQKHDDQVAENVINLQSLALGQLDALKEMLEGPGTITTGGTESASSDEQLRLMKAKLAESDKNLADSKSQLADKDARIAELMQHMTDLTHSLNKNADIPKPPMSDYSEALKLIEQIQGTVSRKVLEVPVDHFTECTAAEGRNASVGLIFEEKGGKIMVVSTLVGSPAYGCQKLQAGDEVRVHVQESELERGRVGSEMHCRPVCEASM